MKAMSETYAIIVCIIVEEAEDVVVVEEEVISLTLHLMAPVEINLGSEVKYTHL